MQIREIEIVGGDYVGGFAGWSSGEIENSSVTGNIHSIEQAGGMVGFFNGRISNCFSRTNVESNWGVGGIASLGAGDVFKSFSTGIVIGDENVTSKGGLYGRSQSNPQGQKMGIAYDCFWDIETSAIEKSDGGIGLTTAEMKDINTYLDAGWDFEKIWAIDGVTNDGYPFFKNTITTVEESESDILVSIYPNPTKDKLFFDDINLNSIKSIGIYNVNGEMVFEPRKYPQ